MHIIVVGFEKKLGERGAYVFVLEHDNMPNKSVVTAIHKQFQTTKMIHNIAIDTDKDIMASPRRTRRPPATVGTAEVIQSRPVSVRGAVRTRFLLQTGHKTGEVCRSPDRS